MKRFQLHIPAGCLAVLAATTIGCTILRAQDLGSTLVRLSERSDLIVQARVLNARAVGAEQRVVFKVQRAWKGNAPDTLTLTEARGRVCGQALHGTLVGASYLLFLTDDSVGVRLTVSSSRAVVRIDPDIIAHVRALLAAKTASERLTVLTTSLNSRNLRVHRDAALALPTRRGLEAATSSDRDRIRAALQVAIHGDAPAALGLVRTVARLRLRAAMPVLLRTYMDGSATSLHRVLLQVIPALDAAYAADQIERGLPTDTKGQLRAIAMLSRCPGRRAADCLRRIAGSRNPAVSSVATEALVAQAVAAKERVVTRTHRFRSIRPQARR